MRHRSRGAAPLLLVGAVALAGCGFWSDEPDAPGEGESVPTQAGADTADRVAPNPATDTLPTLLSGPVEQTVAQAGDTSDAAAPTSADSASVPPEAPLSVTATDLATIRARLDQIVLAQSALSARLDSLSTDAAAPRAQTTTDAGEVLGQARESVRSFGVGVVWGVVVLVLFNYVIHGLVWVLDALAERSVARRLFFKKLVPITRILLWVLAAYIVVRVIFRVDAQTLLAAAAAVGVAIGFAAQDLLKNLFGGIILVFDQPFQVGDKISVAGTYGEVVSIGLRSTRIVTADDNLVSVPNAQVVDGQVANANAGQLNCQVVTDLYLPGFVDEARAKRIAFEAAASSKYVYLNKPIVVLVKDEFKETFLTHLKVKAYVLDPRFEFLFQSDVTERARAGFRDEGILRAGHGLRAYLDLSRTDGSDDPEETADAENVGA